MKGLAGAAQRGPAGDKPRRVTRELSAIPTPGERTGTPPGRRRPQRVRLVRIAWSHSHFHLSPLFRYTFCDTNIKIRKKERKKIQTRTCLLRCMTLARSAKQRKQKKREKRPRGRSHAAGRSVMRTNYLPRRIDLLLPFPPPLFPHPSNSCYEIHL